MPESVSWKNSINKINFTKRKNSDLLLKNNHQLTIIDDLRTGKIENIRLKISSGIGI